MATPVLRPIRARVACPQTLRALQPLVQLPGNCFRLDAWAKAQQEHDT